MPKDGNCQACANLLIFKGIFGTAVSLDFSVVLWYNRGVVRGGDYHFSAWSYPSGNSGKSGRSTVKSSIVTGSGSSLRIAEALTDCL